jgi:uncharacterized membrane protein YbhN (UPF0104 family)
MTPDRPEAQDLAGAHRPRSFSRVALGLLVRLVVPAVAFLYLFKRIGTGDFTQAARQVSVGAALSSLGWIGVGVVLGVVRWRYMLRAAGAQGVPSWGALLRLYLIGMFFNLLPGAVGGDVFRGYTTRTLFAESATTRAMGVALVERILGLLGLLALAAVATLLSPLGSGPLALYAWLGLSAVAAGMVGLIWGRRLLPFVPVMGKRVLTALTVLDRPGPLLGALLLSVVTHITTSMIAYAVIEHLMPEVSFGGAMAILPIGTLASYFPLTVAGAGARDATMVLLLAKIGVDKPTALVASLAMLACNVLVSGVGGLLQLTGIGAATDAQSANQP